MGEENDPKDKKEILIKTSSTADAPGTSNEDKSKRVSENEELIQLIFADRMSIVSSAYNPIPELLLPESRQSDSDYDLNDDKKKDPQGLRRKKYAVRKKESFTDLTEDRHRRIAIDYSSKMTQDDESEEDDQDLGYDAAAESSASASREFHHKHLYSLRAVQRSTNESVEDDDKDRNEEKKNIHQYKHKDGECTSGEEEEENK